MRGHLEVVKELLRNKANIEATNHNGSTPFIRGIFLNRGVHTPDKRTYKKVQMVFTFSLLIA